MGAGAISGAVNYVTDVSKKLYIKLIYRANTTIQEYAKENRKKLKQTCTYVVLCFVYMERGEDHDN